MPLAVIQYSVERFRTTSMMINRSPGVSIFPCVRAVYWTQWRLPVHRAECDPNLGIWMAGGRKDGLQLNDTEFNLLVEAYDRWGGTKRDLADQVNRAPETIYKLFRNGYTGRATLVAISDFLNVDFPRLLPQLSFEFEITREFIEDAQRAIDSNSGPVTLRGVLYPMRNTTIRRRELRIASKAKTAQER